MPYKPTASKRPDTWWTRAMTREAFMRTAADEQRRMSAECDPSIFWQHVKREHSGWQVARAAKKQQMARRFLPGYAETPTTDEEEAA